MSRKDYTKRDRTVPTPDPPQPDHVPTPDAEPLARGEATGGAMTGETGVLSPAGEPDGFVPAERREMEDPRHAGVAGPLRHPAAAGENDIGAEKGLSETDPAYREEPHLPAPDSGDEERS